jgi:hypothetical protein
VRAKRFHTRKAWLFYTEGTIEIDRGAIPFAAAGNWPSTVAIRCGDLYLFEQRYSAHAGIGNTGI